MKLLAVLLLLAFGLSACSSSGRIIRTTATAYKTDAEIKADLYDCQQGSGWFLFGPAVIVLPLILGMAAGQEQQQKNCIEAKGYRIVYPAEEPSVEDKRAE